MTAQFSKEKQNQIEAMLRQTVKNATPDCWMEIKSKAQQMEQKAMLPEEIGDNQMQNPASVVELKNKKAGKKQWVVWYRWCAAALIVLLCDSEAIIIWRPASIWRLISIRVLNYSIIVWIKLFQ